MKTDLVPAHKHETLNKADPRFDSDLDNRAQPNVAAGNPGMTGATNTTGTYGTTPSSNYGPQIDPRVDSDRDGRNNPSSTLGSATAGGAYQDTTYSGSTNAGPHSSNLANKLDPRVDSDRVRFLRRVSSWLDSANNDHRMAEMIQRPVLVGIQHRSHMGLRQE